VRAALPPTAELVLLLADCTSRRHRLRRFYREVEPLLGVLAGFAERAMRALTGTRSDQSESALHGVVPSAQRHC
jgi:hypothetical protein